MFRESAVPAHRTRRIPAVILGALAVTMMTGCAVGTPPPSPEPSASAPTSPEAPAAPVALVPDGDAAANLPFFAEVVAQAAGSEAPQRTMTYVDALVAAGFPKERMQATADRTTVGRPAESVQFSVAWDDAECLVGQVGPSTGAPVTAVMPRLADGSCLIGETVPLDG